MRTLASPPRIVHLLEPMVPNKWIVLAGFLTASFTAAALGGWATAAGRRSWYQTLVKPSWSPPDAVFGPVWTLLFVLMSVAAWRIWLHRDEPRVATSVGAFFGQLGLNVAWPVLFFGLRRPGMALGEILVLWGVLAWMQVRFWGLDAVAGWLWLPYLLWVTFACALNMATWKLNS